METGSWRVPSGKPSSSHIATATQALAKILSCQVHKIKIAGYRTRRLNTMLHEVRNKFLGCWVSELCLNHSHPHKPMAMLSARLPNYIPRGFDVATSQMNNQEGFSNYSLSYKRRNWHILVIYDTNNVEHTIQNTYFSTVLGKSCTVFCALGLEQAYYQQVAFSGRERGHFWRPPSSCFPTVL